MSSRASLCVLILFASSVGFGGPSTKKIPQNLSKISSNDEYHPFLINNVFNYYSNNGDGSFNPFSIGGEGFEFPKGSGKQLFFEDGLILTGYQQTRLNGTQGPVILKVSGSAYNHSLQAGPITASGSASTLPTAADPGDAHYRLYRVRPDINPHVAFAGVKGILDSGEVPLISRFESCSSQTLYDQYIKDWNEWPAELGAPFVYGKDASGLQRRPPAPYDPNFDTPGEPDADQTLWHVSNDLDVGRSIYFGQSDGFGLEIQRTIWGYHKPQSPGWSSYGTALDQTIFIRTLFINKSGLPIDTMYVGQWSDPDIGGASGMMKNFLGCDTVRSLGYAYGAGPDSSYGSAVPSGGFVLLQGPVVPSPAGSAVFRWHERHGYKNIPMTALTDGTVPPLGPSSPVLPYLDLAITFYHMCKGDLGTTGGPMIDPTTGEPTPFAFSGDPVLRFGWIALNTIGPSDVRMLMGSGPFSMAVGDTQEVIAANIAGASSDPFLSITALRATAGTARMAYQSAVSSEPTTGIDLKKEFVPTAFELMQNYPNPFNPSTTIRYALPERARVTLSVFNLLGQRVSLLVDEEVSPGYHEVNFAGNNFASGAYICVLKAAGHMQARRMLLIR